MPGRGYASVAHQIDSGSVVDSRQELVDDRFDPRTQPVDRLGREPRLEQAPQPRVLRGIGRDQRRCAAAQLERRGRGAELGPQALEVRVLEAVAGEGARRAQHRLHIIPARHQPRARGCMPVHGSLRAKPRESRIRVLVVRVALEQSIELRYHQPAWAELSDVSVDRRSPAPRV